MYLVKGTKNVSQTLSKEMAKSMFRDMWRIRRFEQEVFEFYKRGLMPGLAHLYLGEEAVAVGTCAALRLDDYIGSTHRGHGHLLAKGADMDRMMAEILGKATGYSKGKGGSMHIMAMDKGVLGANGIVGGGIPIATGAGYSCKYRNTDQIVVCFFGDGASNEGTFHESVNMAAAWDLPVLYVIENNQYGITVDINRVTKEHDLAKRAIGYGIDGYTIDGNDVMAVYETVREAAEKARGGGGPAIIECKTYRWQGHNVGDPGKYRPAEEVKYWKERDPVELLLARGLLTEEERKEIEDCVETEVQAACKFAVDSPYPEESELMTDIFSN